MVSHGIITKIQEGEPTAWVNSLVYRKKRLMDLEEFASIPTHPGGNPTRTNRCEILLSCGWQI